MSIRNLRKGVGISGIASVVPPDQPIAKICKFCGKSYNKLDISRDTAGNVTYRCPECKEVILDENAYTREQLRENLTNNFQVPINNLNDDTQDMWHKTIRFAQYGFVIRMALSVIVFIIGMVLLGMSSWQFFFGNISPDRLLGVGITFVSGLGTMLSVVYAGPLRDIRESICDLGTSNVAFIAYIHQILQISHTYSYYYLNQQISFEEMSKCRELIKSAMLETVGVLLPKELPKLEDDF